MTAKATDVTLTLTSDQEVDAGYLDTGLGGVKREVASTVPIRDADGRVYGALDLSADGVLLGIEILDVSRRFPRAAA